MPKTRPSFAEDQNYEFYNTLFHALEASLLWNETPGPTSRNQVTVDRNWSSEKLERFYTILLRNKKRRKHLDDGERLYLDLDYNTRAVRTDIVRRADGVWDAASVAITLYDNAIVTYYPPGGRNPDEPQGYEEIYVDACNQLTYLTRDRLNRFSPFCFGGCGNSRNAPERLRWTAAIRHFTYAFADPGPGRFSVYRKGNHFLAPIDPISDRFLSTTARQRVLEKGEKMRIHRAAVRRRSEIRRLNEAIARSEKTIPNEVINVLVAALTDLDHHGNGFFQLLAKRKLDLTNYLQAASEIARHDLYDCIPADDIVKTLLRNTDAVQQLLADPRGYEILQAAEVARLQALPDDRTRLVTLHAEQPDAESGEEGEHGPEEESEA